jgi:hypothetical protein
MLKKSPLKKKPISLRKERLPGSSVGLVMLFVATNELPTKPKMMKMMI